MNKKLYIFGDSFSKNFSTEVKIDEKDTWTYLLATELNLELADNAYSGISNQGMLQMIYRYLDVSDSDLIIFGMTFFNRIYDFYKNGGVDIMYNTKEQLIEKGIYDYEIEFYTKRLLDDEGFQIYLTQQFEQFHFLFKTLRNFNKKFYFWCLDDTTNPAFAKLKSEFADNHIPNPNGQTAWFKQFIDKTPEWWQKNNDRHFSEYGHKQFFQYLYPYIQQNLI